MKSSETIDFQDPMFMVSRDIDGDLSEKDRAELAQLLRESDSLRAEEAELRKVSGWVAALRTQAPQLDWKTHHKLVQATIEDEVGLDKVDAALAQWQGAPAYDERLFVRRVLARIAPARAARNPKLRSIVRLGAPLAAAAAIVMVLTVSRQFPPAPVGMAVTEVHVGPALEQVDVVVSFSRVSGTAAEGSETGAIGFMALGSGPVPQAQEESPL